jgi:aryl-alcohol dehydrogenase-like predicted oxidoreductase
MIGRRVFFGGGLTLIGCSSSAPKTDLREPSPGPVQPADVMKTASMPSRPMPRTGEQLGVIGLGAWPGDAPADRARARTALSSLLADGGRVLDIAASGAEAEQAAGDLLAEVGVVQQVFLATRVRRPGHKEGQMQMERTLGRLGRRRIDLMQIHDLIDFSTHLETLRRWRAVGHARYIGATIDSIELLPALERELPTALLDTVQLPYSIFSRAADERALPAAAEHGVAVLVSRPLGDAEALARLRRRPLPTMAAELECTCWEQLLLKWLLAHPAVHCVLPGADEVLGAVDLLRAGLGPMPDKDQRRDLVTLVEAG